MIVFSRVVNLTYHMCFPMYQFVFDPQVIWNTAQIKSIWMLTCTSEKDCAEIGLPKVLLYLLKK